MTKDKIELGFPTKAGYIGVKIPSKVAILGMKIGTGWLVGAIALIAIAIGFLWYSWYGGEKGYTTGDSPHPDYPHKSGRG